MYSSEDFEKLWFLYKLDGQSKNILVESFCLQQGVSYAAFSTWFSRRKKRIIPVEIVGMPTVPASAQSDVLDASLASELSTVGHICCIAHVRARFQKALLQGRDVLVKPFMDWIGKLYDFERNYSKEPLLPDEIKKTKE